MHNQSIFVFGSNQAGRHGAGAARHARVVHGAQFGIGEGLTGNAYALPTMDHLLRPRLLADIARSVITFLAFAENAPHLVFQVTRIGCGIAGFRNEDIAPLFRGAPRNCVLPDGWRALNGETADTIAHVGDG